MLLRYLVILLFAGSIIGCVEPYAPPEILDRPDFIVIDAFLDGTDNSCFARITKAVPLNSEVGFEEVQENAFDPITVFVEDEQGTVFDVARVGQGRFESTGLTLDHTKKYRLRAEINSETYVSEYVEIRQASPIANIAFEAGQDEVRILVSSQDAGGQGNYYRWTFEETFEYTSTRRSFYILEDREVRLRTPEEDVYRCYGTIASQKILIASSRDLDSDVIKNFLIHSVPRSSQKLQYRYSINVKQMALTEDAYTYWFNIFKTTENVGGLFDPMPGEVIGNFRKLSDPSDKVIGYFSASTVQESRVFLAPEDLPVNYSTFRYPFCEMDTVSLEEVPGLPASTILVAGVYSTGGFPVLIGYSRTTKGCVDCTMHNNGTTQKPSFWP